MPQTESSLLGQPLKLLTVLVARYPISVIIISAPAGCRLAHWAQLQLGFLTSRSDLLNPKSENNRRWAEFTQEFGEQDDVTVVVHSEDPKAVPPILDELAAELNRQPRCSVRSSINSMWTSCGPKDCITIASVSNSSSKSPAFWARRRGCCRAISPRSTWEGKSPGSPPKSIAAIPVNWPPRQAQQGKSLDILAEALGESGSYQSPFREITDRLAVQGDQYLNSGYKLLNDGHIGLLALYLVKNEKSGSFAEYSEGLTELRQIVSDAKSRHPEAWVGLTGLPVMENDEMESSQTAMAQAGVLSFIGVGLLYIAGFGCVRHPVMALTALLVPMGWSFGYILVTVGHLNILSSAFATIVIGLGSDYGVYHIAQYLRYRGEKMSTFDALLATTRSIGPGLTTSAVATAAAFFAIGLSDFPGIAELGIIAGGGILLCWLAALTTLPALIQWSDAHRPPWAVPGADGCLRLGAAIGRPAKTGRGRLCPLNAGGLLRTAATLVRPQSAESAGRRAGERETREKALAERLRGVVCGGDGEEPRRSHAAKGDVCQSRALPDGRLRGGNRLLRAGERGTEAAADPAYPR